MWSNLALIQLKDGMKTVLVLLIAFMGVSLSGTPIGARYIAFVSMFGQRDLDKGAMAQFFAPDMVKYVNGKMVANSYDAFYEYMVEFKAANEGYRLRVDTQTCCDNEQSREVMLYSITVKAEVIIVMVMISKNDEEKIVQINEVWGNFGRV